MSFYWFISHVFQSLSNCFAYFFHGCSTIPSSEVCVSVVSHHNKPILWQVFVADGRQLEPNRLYINHNV